MSQPKSKFPTVKIYPKDPSLSPTGANTVVEIDGVKIPYASFVKVECHSRRVTKVVLEMFAHVEIETMGDLTTQVINLVPKK